MVYCVSHDTGSVVVDCALPAPVTPFPLLRLGPRGFLLLATCARSLFTWARRKTTARRAGRSEVARRATRVERTGRAAAVATAGRAPGPTARAGSRRAAIRPRRA